MLHDLPRSAARPPPPESQRGLPLTRRALAAWPRWRETRTPGEREHLRPLLGLHAAEAAALDRLRENLRAAGCPLARNGVGEPGWFHDGIVAGSVRAGVLEVVLEGLALPAQSLSLFIQAVGLGDRGEGRWLLRDLRRHLGLPPEPANLPARQDAAGFARGELRRYAEAPEDGAGTGRGGGRKRWELKRRHASVMLSAGMEGGVPAERVRRWGGRPPHPPVRGAARLQQHLRSPEVPRRAGGDPPGHDPPRGPDRRGGPGMSTATRSDLQVGDLAVWYKGGTRHESRVRATDSEGISTAQGRVPWSEPTLTRADDATVVEHAGVMPRGITPGVLSLPLGEVRPSPLNPREETDVEALAADLQAHGQINPITVRETGEEPPYEVITGERRLQAAAQAGLTEILAVSRGALSAEEAYRETIRENAQRRDLGPLEEARAVHQMQGWDWGQEEIGKLLGGRSQSWVSRTAALLSLPGPVQAALSASRLSRSQAEELLALGRWPSNQESLAVECEAQGWTAADLAVAVKRRKEYLEAKERPAAPAVVPGDPESERAARERNLAVAIASPPPVEQPAVTPAPPPAAKPGALKSAEEIARERQAARTGEPAPPAPITAIIPGPLRQRFEALGGFAIPALTLWCELAELATEHEITPQLAVRLLGRFLAYCTGLALRPETVISELEENLRKLEAEDSDG